MTKIRAARTLTVDEQEDIERAWMRSKERENLDRQRQQIIEKIAMKKSCHSY